MNDLKNYLTIDSSFFLKEIDPASALNTLLDKGISNYTISEKDQHVPDVLWGKERYQLEKSTAFNALDLQIQHKVLKRITELNLSLSYFIEMSGHNYGAKMILLADSIQEKSLFCMFAAEEAIHMREFSNFMNFTVDPKIHWHPMLNPLGKVIYEGEKNTCLYIIQVLLEGFGMGHYNSLKTDCLYPQLVDVYGRILKDEARHHGAGLILVKESHLNKNEREQIFEYTREFVTALQSANWILNIIEEYSAPLSKAQKAKHYEQVQHQRLMEKRLKSLKDMLLKADRENLVADLERDGVFTPLNVA